MLCPHPSPVVFLCDFKAMIFSFDTLDKKAPSNLTTFYFVWELLLSSKIEVDDWSA